jgi:anti-sigma regulatory factor (Ser/Thr protein kinase)
MPAPGVSDSVVLELPASAVAVAEVRRQLRALLEGTPYVERLGDAETAATELVTNAVLHGRRPITVVLEYDEHRLRVAVTDASPVSPTFSLLDPTAVTGRGLLLVSAVSDGWGVDPGSNEKTVWAEFRAERASADEQADLDALLDAWADDLAVDPALEVVRVVLTDVETAKLVANEVYVEGVLRELTLLMADDACEAQLRATAAQVVAAAEAIELARVELRRQLALAVTQGAPTLDIELAITRHHAELVRDYRDALAEADRLCATEQLLHERPSPGALTVRQDYLRRILAQLSS